MSNKSKQLGFTLIELVMGIIAFAIVITLVIGLIVPQATRSIDPIFQVRATELAQGLINEINAKAFDEQSDDSNGMLVRCGESAASVAQSIFGSSDADLIQRLIDGNAVRDCTEPSLLGPDSESRVNFDDVDDFNGLTADGSSIVNSLGESLELSGLQLYDGFQLQVSVFYDANFDGIPDTGAGNAKLIAVTVITPTNETLQFSTYRTNF